VGMIISVILATYKLFLDIVIYLIETKTFRFKRYFLVRIILLGF